MIKKSIHKYSDEYLFERICDNFNLNHVLLLEDEFEHNIQFELYNDYILSKIRLILNDCMYILIENEYTEAIWKEIFSIHYAHTSYCNNNKVMRIHFFNKTLNLNNEINNDILTQSYLGYITLRPVPDFNLMLSFVVPNWNILKYKEDSYIMTCEKIVHIFSYKIHIRTFSFYSQDSVVTTCAQADIIMFSTYTNIKYNHKMIKVSDIQEYMKYSPLPSKGLTAKEMLEIFRSNGSPVDYHLKKKIKDKRKYTKHKEKGIPYNESLNHITNIVDSYIESGLPVIAYKSKHVVLIIGHTKNRRHYIIYDDSGAFLKNVNGEDSFIGTVSNRQLFPNNNETTYLICATHGRVYLTAEEYDGFVDEEIENLDISQSFISRKRNIIIDNVDLKSYLRSLLNSGLKFDEYIKQNIIGLINKNLPHYLWYTELLLKNNTIIVLIGDTTYPVNTNLNIFKLVCCIPSDYQLSLLTHITK